jgi:DNA-binding response OmpR family regulator
MPGEVDVEGSGRILIVEDVIELADLYRVYLEHDGRKVEIATSAERAIAAMETGVCDWDLVVLDLNLPGMDGFDFLRLLRDRSAVPVMILSARSGDDDVLRGLDSGADDFVAKPCPPRVLAARVRARLAAGQARERGPGQLRFGRWLVDREAQLVYRDGLMVGLSPREYGVLAYLIERGGKPAPPSLIYSEVWRQEYGDVSAVGVIVQRLRRKIEEDPEEPRIIQTIFRHGYRFDPDLLARPPEEPPGGKEGT